MFSITLCWSTSYIFIKDIPATFSIFSYLALTSGVAGLILLFGLWRRLSGIDRMTFLRGLILAVLIMGNMIFEKLSLDRLPVSAVSTIASMNIVIVPIILTFMRKYPTKNQVAGIIIIQIGILISNHLTFSSNLAVNLQGVILVLLSCVMMSLYTVLAADYTKQSDPLILTMLQLCLTALFGLVLWIITDPGSFRSITYNSEVISYILLIALFSKCYAYVMLMVAEKYADALSVTIVASMEPLVTLVMAILLPSIVGSTEAFSPLSLLGTGTITLGAIVAGTNFLDRKKRNMVRSETDTKADRKEDIKPVSHRTSEKMPAPWLVFLVIVVLFAVLTILIDVMEFAEGYSQTRPANILPPVTGVLFGPIGAIACSVGNFLGDLPYIMEYGGTVVIGIVANFLAAYIPYKMWFAVTDKEVSAHSWKGILLYLWGVLVGNMLCSCLLGYGLEMAFGVWEQNLIPLSFVNNIVFSVFFGLPILIVLTSDEVGWGAWRRKYLRPGRLFHKKVKTGFPLWIILVAYTVLVGALFGAGAVNVPMHQNRLLEGLAMAAGIATLCVCVMPEKRGE